MEIVNPLYSFVKFTNQIDSCEQILPILQDDELMFQIFIRGDNGTSLGTFESGLQIDLTDLDGNVIKLNAGLLSYIDIDESEGIFYPADYINIYFDNETCFRIRFNINDTYYYSNCFKFMKSFEYSTLLSYRNNENSNGFNYCDWNFMNRIRLPFYLTKPQFKDTETIYLKSNGIRQVLTSSTAKSYSGIVDYMNEDMHEKLKVGLSSDVIYVESPKYSGFIVKDGDYDIDWPEGESSSAPASFKALVTPYTVRNTNCNTCP